MTNIAQTLQLAVRHHQAGRLEDARAIYEEILAAQPRQPDALNLMGVLAQQSGQLGEAKSFFQRAIASHPNAAGTHVNYGNVLRLNGELDAAEKAYRKALKLKPDAFDAHNNLGSLHETRGQLDKAEACYRKALELRPEYPEALYNLGSVTHKTGRLDEAVGAYSQALKLNPSHADAYSNLGSALQERGDLDNAEIALGHALKLNPSSAEVWFNLGNLYNARKDLDRSVAAFDRALKIKPDFAEAHRNLGGQLGRAQKFEDAERHHREAIRLAPDSPDAWNDLGLTLKGDNRTEEAEAAFQKAIELQADSAGALGNLVTLLEEGNRLDEAQRLATTGLQRCPDDPMLNMMAARLCRREGRNEEALERLEKINLDVLPQEGASRVHYELGQVLERLKRAADAWPHFVAANAELERETKSLGIGKHVYLDKLDATESQLTPELVRSWLDDPVAPTADTPVFLVGFPRSGTTLLEVALDSHPQLMTMEEKPFVVDMERLDLMGLDEIRLSNLDNTRAEELRRQYFEMANQYVPERGDATLVDKLPLRIADAPVIWRMFPEAKFILALRHPADAVLSCFMQSFQPNVAMAHFNTLEDTAKLYDRIMSLWQRYAELLPLRFHIVRYEDSVADFEGQIRKLLEFLEIPWDDTILEYRSRARRMTRINTPSYHQVTEPIYDRARYRWERYRDQLAPVMDLLKPWIETWGYKLT
jgi:tetratricopeptide (TPR) repeat protein